MKFAVRVRGEVQVHVAQERVADLVAFVAFATP